MRPAKPSSTFLEVIEEVFEEEKDPGARRTTIVVA
jgi:hypothetical protein